MTTITITNINQLRAGDIATLSYEGHEFTGEVWTGAYGELRVGATFIRFADGRSNSDTHLVSATREVPDLPTELGSVIANVDTLFGHYDWAMLAGLANGMALSWIVSSANRYRWVRPEEITSWTPCTVEVQEDSDY